MKMDIMRVDFNKHVKVNELIQFTVSVSKYAMTVFFESNALCPSTEM